MKSIDVFYQGEGITALEHIEIAEHETFRSLRIAIAEKHGASEEAILFIENEIEPIGDDELISSKAGRAGIKAHIHRCRKVKVVVHFKHHTVDHEFSPGTTVAHIKHWAAVKKFHMTEEEASHHHLQIAGTTDQPDPGTHIGTLVASGNCEIKFDLVSTPKVNG
ncbi:MAG: hypothetical protein WC696_12340 [Candidatus Methylopumilus sp.]|jgi:hypothetical protein